MMILYPTVSPGGPYSSQSKEHTSAALRPLLSLEEEQTRLCELNYHPLKPK